MNKEKKVKPSKIPKLVPYILEHYIKLLQVAGAIVAVIFSYLVYKSSTSAVQNLINADHEALKGVFLGNKPYLIYCNRGTKDENVPPVFSELHSVMGSKMGFAVVNCSQALPSGSNIWQRFKLKKEWRPTVFGTAPWLHSKALQAPPTSLKDLSTIKKFVETSFAPKGYEITSDKQFTKFCNSTSSSTCIVLIKGSRYIKAHAEMEAQLVLSNPGLSVASVDAKKRRISFEDSLDLPADQFAMRIHAIRELRYYMSMEYPLNPENIRTFLSRALTAPTSEYLGDEKSQLRLVKPAIPGFKPRGSGSSPSTGPTGSAPPSSFPTSDNKDSSSRSSQASAKAAAGEGKEESLSKEDEAIRKQQQLERERQRREEMDRSQNEYLYDTDRDHDSKEESEDDGEDDVIEV